MNVDRKIKKITEKSQMRLDKAVIIIGILLIAASGFSYFVIDAFGQQGFALNCPNNAYHGLDGQGNEACRDILTNQILQPESVIVTSIPETIAESDSEKIPSSEVIHSSETPDAISDDNTSFTEIVLFVMIAVSVGIFVVLRKNKMNFLKIHTWNASQKEQVRNRQYGKCNMCFTIPSKWKYDYFDGNKKNDDLNNCQGLCHSCFSKKSERDSRISFYQ